jgi:hypothetical protein
MKVLINNFFNLDGNFKNVKERNDLEKEIENQLEASKIPDIKLLETLRAIKSFSQEFEFNNFEEACKISSPTIERLMYTAIDNWELYDIRMAQHLVIWSKSFEESVSLARKVLSALKNYPDHELYYEIKLKTNLNVIIRLLKADYYEIDAEMNPDQSEKIEEFFNEHLKNILDICEAKKEFKKYEIVTLIRVGIFERDFTKVERHLKELKELDEQELYQAMKNNITTYSSRVDFLPTGSQIQAIFGLNIIRLREKFSKNIKIVENNDINGEYNISVFKEY